VAGAARSHSTRRRQDSNLMIVSRKKDKGGDKTDKGKPSRGGASKPQQPRLPVDDPYETGDIAAPERDRDDEQRDL
jgi:hypothetical protein